MFAVIYMGFIKPSLEQDYQSAWKIVASYFVAHRGAIGSCLHRRSDGAWVAYSRWPDKETKEASWPSGDATPEFDMPSSVQLAIATIKNSLDHTKEFSEVHLDVVEDLLKKNEHVTSTPLPGEQFFQ